MFIDNIIDLTNLTDHTPTSLHEENKKKSSVDNIMLKGSVEDTPLTIPTASNGRYEKAWEEFIIHNFTYIEKGVKCRGKKLTYPSVESTISKPRFISNYFSSRSYLARAEKYLDESLTLG